MAQFIAKISRWNADSLHRLGTKNKGISVSLNGWDRGLYVKATHEEGRDVFRIYVNGGSNSPANIKLLDTVYGPEVLCTKA